MSKPKLSPSIVVIILATIYLVAIAAPVEYSASLWGINHLTYCGWGTRLAVLLGGILAALLLMTLAPRVRLGRTAKLLAVYVIFPLLLVGLFYLLRVKSHYLGDGILRAREIEIDRLLLPTEPLGYLANVVMFKLASLFFSLQPIQGMELLSFVSGIVHYYAALYFVRTIFAQAAQRVFAFVLVFFSGTTLLFCGYAETYTLLPALLALFIGAGIRAVRRELSPLVPMVLYLLLVLFHFQFLYLVPALCFLAYCCHRNGEKRAILSGGVALAATIAASVIVPAVAEVPTLSVTALMTDLAPGENSYWLLSGRHLLDIANELLLTAAATLALTVAVLSSGRWRGLRENAPVAFVGLSLLGALAFMLFLHSALGYPSDWDLFSSAGVTITLFALTFYASADGFALGSVPRVALSAIALVSFLAFAAVYSDYDKSFARQIDILSVSGEQGAIGFETMGNDFSSSGKLDLAEQMWKRSLRLRPHWRPYGNLGQLALKREQYDEAEYYLKRGLALDSTRALLIMNLGMAYCGMRNYALADRYLHKATAMAPDGADFHQNYAVCLGSQGRFVEAEAESREAVRLKPNDAMFLTTLASILRDLGKYSESENYFIQAIRLQPAYTESYLALAELYQMVKQVDRAREVLRTYLANFPGGSDASRVNDALANLDKSK